MAPSPLRYRRLIQALPKHNYKISPAAIEAGFAPSTVDKSAGRIARSAIKQRARDIIDMVDDKKKITKNEIKQFMSDIVGLSREDVMGSLKYIATQQRDLNSALKVLGPLSKEHGVILQEEDQSKVTVPILNVTVKDKTAQLGQGRVIYADNADCATSSPVIAVEQEAPQDGQAERE